MSTGLTIHKATYGVGSTTEDVTGAVSSKVKDGVLNFTVSATSLNVEDPAPGQTKTLDISYTVNDGHKNSMTRKDGDLVFIDAPPARLASGLQIKKANYGYAGNWTDVTDAIQNHVNDGAINITVGFKTAGIPDPNPNKQKQLQVEYEINGAPTIASFNDGDKFQVSAPPRQGPPGNFSNGVSSVIGSIFAGLLKFAGAYLYVGSAFTSQLFGKQWLGDTGGYAFLMAGFVMPYFAIWGIPVLAFFVRLFRATDLVTKEGFGSLSLTNVIPGTVLSTPIAQ